MKEVQVNHEHGERVDAGLTDVVVNYDGIEGERLSSTRNLQFVELSTIIVRCVLECVRLQVAVMNILRFWV